MWGGFIKDKRGIEGLPMRLIIIVVVAAVVLAAILAMIPKTTPSALKVEFGEVKGLNNVTDSRGGVILVDASNAGWKEINDISFNITVKVKDTSNKPVSGANVIISGAGTAASAQTNGKGIAYVHIKNAKLGENEERVYMTVKVKASGYPDYEKSDDIILQRVPE